MPKPKKRKVYPLDITELSSQLALAQKTTGIKSRATLMRMAIARGLPVLLAQLKAEQTVQRAA